jgi:hypothetical protein
VALLLARQNKYNKYILRIGSECTIDSLFFISDPQPEHNSRINNIEHTISLVNEPKLAYTTPYLNKGCCDDEIQQMLLYCSVNDSMNKGT